jgi:two-component system, NarL family, response regulator NreC
MSKTRVLIVDDHALVRAGLRALLAAEPDLEIAGEAGDGVDAVTQCQKTRPDVVLMDLNMPGRGGIQAIEELHKVLPGLKAVVVSMHEDPAFAREALRAGASGYVLKKALASELIRAIHSVMEGRQYLCPDMVTAMADRRRDILPSREDFTPAALTPPEQEVIRLIASGYTTTEIGLRLHLSENAVESHRKNICEKLGARGRADLVRFAIQHKLTGA